MQNTENSRYTFKFPVEEELWQEKYKTLRRVMAEMNY